MGLNQDVTPQGAQRALSRTLADAEDEKILRVVAMVDALERRGGADDLIAPLRPRLAQLRPAKPLRFARLLFLPLDALIVQPSRWRPGSATIPRSAIAPLAEAVHAGLGADAAAIDAAIAGRTADDRQAVADAGNLLWPRAGAILASVPALPGWPATGLRPAAAGDLARAAVAALLAAGDLRDIAAEAESGMQIDPETVQDILAGVAGHGAEALAMAVAVFLARLPQAAGMLQRGASMLGADGMAIMRLAARQATEVLLGRLEVPGGAENVITAAPLEDSGLEARRAAIFLDALDASEPPTRKRRVALIRGRMDESCRSRFAKWVDDGVLAVLRPLDRGATPAELVCMEKNALGLRCLEGEARRLGGSAFYDALLKEASALVRGSPLSLVDKVRLVEILENSDVADALRLEKARAAARAKAAIVPMRARFREVA